MTGMIIVISVIVLSTLLIFQTLFHFSFFFFFNDTATTEIHTLSLHDALPILGVAMQGVNLKMEQTDEALANTLNAINQSGAEIGRAHV